MLSNDCLYKYKLVWSEMWQGDQPKANRNIKKYVIPSRGEKNILCINLSLLHFDGFHHLKARKLQELTTVKSQHS